MNPHNVDNGFWNTLWDQVRDELLNGLVFIFLATAAVLLNGFLHLLEKLEPDVFVLIALRCVEYLLLVAAVFQLLRGVWKRLAGSKTPQTSGKVQISRLKDPVTVTFIGVGLLAIAAMAGVVLWYGLRIREIQGRVVDGISHRPIRGAVVQIDGLPSAVDGTNDDGQFTLTYYEYLPVVKVTASSEYFESAATSIRAPQAGLVRRFLEPYIPQLSLEMVPCTVNGFVRDIRNVGLPGIKVVVGNNPGTTTDSNGFFRAGIPCSILPGTQLTVVAERGSNRVEKKVLFSRDGPCIVTFGLPPILPSRVAPHPSPVGKQQWFWVREDLKMARAALQRSSYGDAFNLYVDAWNNLPVGVSPPIGLRGGIDKQEEVRVAWGEYGDGNFKAAADRMARVLDSLGIPNQ